MLTVGLVASIISLLVIVIAMAILGFSIERGEQQYDADNVDNNADNADTSDASNPVPATTFDDTTIAMAILGFSIERGEQQYDADNVDNNADNADTSDASNPVPATTFDDTTTLTDNMSENTNTYPVSHTTSDTASFNTEH